MSRYGLFMMRQPKGKPMSIYINKLLEAADFADIYQLTMDKILITLTLATCKDDNMKQELIKLDSTENPGQGEHMEKERGRINMKTRMLAKNNTGHNKGRHRGDLRMTRSCDLYVADLTNRLSAR